MHLKPSVALGIQFLDFLRPHSAARLNCQPCGNIAVDKTLKKCQPVGVVVYTCARTQRHKLTPLHSSSACCEVKSHGHLRNGVLSMSTNFRFTVYGCFGSPSNQSSRQKEGHMDSRHLTCAPSARTRRSSACPPRRSRRLRSLRRYRHRLAVRPPHPPRRPFFTSGGRRRAVVLESRYQRPLTLFTPRIDPFEIVPPAPSATTWKYPSKKSAKYLRFVAVDETTRAN